MIHIAKKCQVLVRVRDVVLQEKNQGGYLLIKGTAVLTRQLDLIKIVGMQVGKHLANQIELKI